MIENQTIHRVGRLFVLVVFTMAFAFALPGTTDATSLNEVKKLTASDAAAGDDFGVEVAISGDTAVVGASQEDFAANLPGAAYLFERDQGGADNWGEIKKLLASDAQNFDRFGFSVAISGDTAVVGAFGESAGGSSAGAAYVFQRNQGGAGNWGEVRKLTASDAQAVDHFGWSVAISGDTVVVGARLEDAGGFSAGAAYVFQRNQGGAGNWGEVKKLTASDPEDIDRFGGSVAVSGDTAVVGARRESAGGTHAGAAYMFQRDEGGPDNWGEVKKLTASDAGAFDNFGRSVAVSGDTAVAGASNESTGGPNAGAVYVFQRDEGGPDNWGEVKKLTASDAQARDHFGWSVAVSGDTAVVGLRPEDFGANNAGAAYMFQRDEGGPDNWGEVKKFTASDAQAGDRFGVSVAVSGDTAVAGAIDEDGATEAGAAYVLDLLLTKSTPTITPTATPTTTSTPTITPTATPTTTSTPTITPTATPSATLNPVGGIALDSDLRLLPLEATESAGSPLGVAAAAVAAALLVALGGGAWYARRRRA